MCGSKSPGTERLSAPVRSAVRFSKSCAVPPGAITSEPFGVSIHAPPTKKLIVPSIRWAVDVRKSDMTAGIESARCLARWVS
jgi:hypothetical protein